MTIDKWAKVIGVSRSAAYRKVAAGEVALTNVGDRGRLRLRITEQDHQDYLKRVKMGAVPTRRRVHRRAA
jgi:predicted site-specific integrase-resolvase